MRLIPLDAKCSGLFHALIPTVQPEVCPFNDKLPFLQTRICLGKCVRYFHPTNYQAEGFKSPLTMQVFHLMTLIENP
jgi:hypothetical protein